MAKPELGFEDTASVELDAKAAALTAAGAVVLSYVKNPSVSSLRIDGPCPRCGHVFSQTQALELPVTAIRGTPATASTPASWADFMCACGVAHPGTPTGEHGCGASFTIVCPDAAGA